MYKYLFLFFMRKSCWFCSVDKLCEGGDLHIILCNMRSGSSAKFSHKIIYILILPHKFKVEYTVLCRSLTSQIQELLLSKTRWKESYQKLTFLFAPYTLQHKPDKLRFAEYWNQIIFVNEVYFCFYSIHKTLLQWIRCWHSENFKMINSLEYTLC